GALDPDPRFPGSTRTAHDHDLASRHGDAGAHDRGGAGQERDRRGHAAPLTFFAALGRLFRGGAFGPLSTFRPRCFESGKNPWPAGAGFRHILNALEGIDWGGAKDRWRLSF